jgi:predicted nucleotidyltransferase
MSEGVAATAEKIGPILRGAPLRLAILFGSAARGRLRRDSDVDVAILPTGEMSLADELDLQAALERAVGRTVDLVRLDRADPIVRYEVARHGSVLVADPPHEAPRFLAAAGIEHADLAPLIADAAERFRRRLAAGQRAS